MARKKNANVKTKADQKSTTMIMSRHTPKLHLPIASKHHKPKADKMTRRERAIMSLKSNLKLNRIQENKNCKSQEKTLSMQQQQPASPSGSALAYYSPNESATALERRVPNSKGKGKADPNDSTNHDLTIYEANYQEGRMLDQQQPMHASASSHIQYQPPNVSRDQPSGGFFEGPTDKVEIKGGTIHHTLGHHITIQVNPPREEQHDMLQQQSHLPHLLPPPQTRSHDPTLSPAQDIRSQFSPMATYSADPSTLTLAAIYSPDNSSTIYQRHLELKQRGFPLWIPEPYRNLPMPYRRKGVNIGDVGIVMPDGGFLFLFNICSPPGDPINPWPLPDGFVPIDIDPTKDICESSEFKSGSYLASAAIVRTDNDPPFRGLSFSTSAAEGAILTFPDGAISRNLVNFRRFREYVKANIKSWYRYVVETRGYEVQNGEIRLVTGCVKATSWGMAAVANVTQHEVHHLKYRYVDVAAATAPIPLYKWEHTGFAEARVGPDLSEIEDLKRTDHSDAAVGGKYWNQCLFIHTLNILLNDDSFASISRGPESALIEDSQQLQDKESSSNSDSTLQNAGAHIYSTGRQQGINAAIQTRSASESLGSAAETLAFGNVERDPIIMTRSPNAPILHPSDVLNKILLRKVPNCRVVITQDEDWCSIIKQDDEITPSPSEIAERVLAAHYIREEDGIVFLEPKKKLQSAIPPGQIPSQQSFEEYTLNVLERIPESSDLDGFDASLLETPYADFGASPLETPYSDFLSTPLSDDALLTHPPIEFLDDQPLFGHAEYNKRDDLPLNPTEKDLNEQKGHQNTFAALSSRKRDDLPLNPTEKDLIEQKRRLNTLAARRSRKRKLEKIQKLQNDLKEERKVKEIWKTRALTMLSTLQSKGFEYPDFSPNEFDHNGAVAQGKV